ncbi:MAG: VWA domain-containing protein [Vicinamibacteria bacterium]|nr:VWA domain-containing protein [Vicinamibacteria bacterium]
MMSFSALQFQTPWWLLLLPLPLLLVFFSRRLEVFEPRLSLPRTAMARSLRPTFRSRFRNLPIWLSAFALTLMVVALARPQKGLGRDQLTTEGVDIVVALDVSGSMAAQDFQPDNRLSVAKSVVADFIKKRTRDRVGLVVFAGRAITQSPATTDQALLLRQLEDVALDRLPDGTAIGSGLATALSRLSKSEAKTKLVVLVTDGANNSGEIDPETATDIAKAMQVKIYTVGVGKGGIAPIPVRAQDPFTGRIVSRTVNMDVPIDEALLKRIAERTGGAFFSATDESSFRDIFARIDALETTRLKSVSFRRFQELFPPFLTAALLFLLVAGFLWTRGLRVLPA